MVTMPAMNERRTEARAVLSASLRALRLDAGLTQAQLAERAGLSPLTINRIENGHSLPEWDIACALADALSVSLDRLREIPENFSENA
jgi:transcriptional regulator with XRE-family HTH domain